VADRFEPPSGTVAFLFSDIEGSTPRWERDRDAMAAALRRHDALVRDAIEANRGYVFKTMGDAFCAAFAAVPDAVASALAIQRALAKVDFSAVEGLPVRIGLHVGSTEEREGDYFGPTVNRIARLHATAWGGQIILSAAAAELARPGLPPEATLRDLGAHRLKDLAEPETIAQLVVPDLRSDFPPLRSLDASRHNLPTQLVPLIGREAVLAAIEDAIAQSRCVTLVGAGGIGKTRTALHVAADLLERFPGGVWYVELAAVAPSSHPDSTLVAEQFASDLGLRETPGRSSLDTVLLWAATREMLLVVDNCEQVIGEAARVVDAILKRSPKVHVFATSREPLGLYGERVVRLPALNDEEAIALFVERAVASDSRFQLTDANAAVVADICRRLDGIALAIELAASRVKILSPPQLAAKLDERFRVLAGARRESIPHHATLHATIAWSYDLLPVRERLVFERLAVFAEAWPLDAALEVCADEGLDEFDAIDAVEALANKSLVAVEGDTDAKTYRLLESTRAFALLQLRERGAYDLLRARHASYALHRAERLDASAHNTPTAEWEREARDASADFRVALGWALHERNDETLGVALVANLRWYWSGLAAREGRDLVARALESADRVEASPLLRLKLELADAAIATASGEHARQHDAAARARIHAAALGDRYESAVALRTYAQALMFLGDGESAEPLLLEALAEFRALDAKRFAALTLDTLGVYRWASKGDLTGARAALEEAVALAAENGFERGLLFFDTNLAEIEFALDNVAAAIGLAERAVHRTYAMREPLSLAIVWSNLAMYYGHEDRWPEAQRAAETALAFAQEADAPAYTDFALQTLAAVKADAGETRAAAQLLGYVDARLLSLGLERGTTESAQHDRLLAALRAALGPSLDEHLAIGTALGETEAERLASPSPIAV
jgi:predicted ATPase/class 3 adenylate cyclase